MNSPRRRPERTAAPLRSRTAPARPASPGVAEAPAPNPTPPRFPHHVIFVDSSSLPGEAGGKGFLTVDAVSMLNPTSSATNRSEQARRRSLPQSRPSAVQTFVRGTLQRPTGLLTAEVFPMRFILHRVLLALTILATVGLAHAEDKAADNVRWTPLWDGKSLKGWHKIGNGEWTIENGVVIGDH